MRYILLDGQLVPNVIGLCARHHHRLTIGESVLRWIMGRWCYQSPERDRPVPLLPLSNEGVIRAAGGRHCPVCGRPPAQRDPYRHSGPTRRREPLTIRVPADAENGAEIITTLAEQVGTMIGLQNPESSSAAYYAISAALVSVLQDPSSVRDLRPSA